MTGLGVIPAHAVNSYCSPYEKWTDPNGNEGVYLKTCLYEVDYSVNYATGQVFLGSKGELSTVEIFAYVWNTSKQILTSTFCEVSAGSIVGSSNAYTCQTGDTTNNGDIKESAVRTQDYYSGGSDFSPYLCEQPSGWQWQGSNCP